MSSVAKKKKRRVKKKPNPTGHVVDLEFLGIFGGDSNCDHEFPEGTMWAKKGEDTFGWPCSECSASLEYRKVRSMKPDVKQEE